MATLKGAGTDDKKKVAIAAALGVVVLVLAVHTIFGGPAQVPPPPAVSVRPASIAEAPTTRVGTTRSADGASSSPTGTTTGLTDPALHPELMAENENYVYSGSGRNIFSATGSAPAAAVAIERVKAPVRPSQQIAVSTGPPPPPAIDLHFFGYSARKNGARKAFLSHGDDVFIASEGDVVSHRYRVVHIAPTSIEVEDLPYHNTQTLPLVQN